ncbi:MAG TPA: VWA domain-containing protein, partial [Herpetosiphonaceae bacterium]
MSVSFVDPRYLWLLLALAPVVALGWGGQRLATLRRGLSLALRVLLLAALAGGLAGAQLVSPVRDLTTIFLLDVSDSVSPNQRAAQEQFVAEALRAMPDGDRAAIVVFGENAVIERLPSAGRTLGQLQSVPVVARTNIEDALRLGLTLFPADTQKRLVLLSDGGENSGRALTALRLAQSRDVAIDVVQTSLAAGAEVALTSLETVTQARDGQEIQLVANVESSVAQPGTVRFLVDQQIVGETPVQIPAGSSSYTSTIILNAPGYHQVTAQIVPSDDIRKQNNEASALINILGPPQVLIVAGAPEDGRNLADALRAARLVPVVVTPDAIPTTLGGLADYQAVVIANVNARNLPDETQRTLQSFVRDLGRGLVMIGGDQSYGIGGYTGTPIEEMLPVDMQLRNREKFPPVSVAVVFDISGSMGEMVGGRQKVELAAEGAARVAQLLRDFDEISVLPFDGRAQNPYGPVPGTERETAVEEILARGVVGGGGIDVFPALRDAGDMLKGRTLPIRHIILLADGSDSQSQEGAVQLAERQRGLGITTSVVAVGNGGDVPFLRNVAAAGGGRFFLVEDASQLPDIVLEEGQLAFAPYLVEETFLPSLGNDSPILADLLDENWPQIHGYNGTEPKDNAQVALYALDEAPLLAQWQYGLGRTVAWTSDFKGKWGRDLVVWDQFPRLAAQTVGWTLPVVSNDNIGVSTAFVGSEIEVTVYARDPSDLPLTGHAVTVDVVGADGVVRQATLREIGAGVYQGRVASPETGTYFLQLGGADAGGRPVFQRSAGVIVPYSPEYRQGQANPALVAAIAAEAGGRVIEQPAAAFDHTLRAVRRATPVHFGLLLLALLLLPLDIAVRRLRLGKLGELRLGRRKAAPTEPQLAGLAAAK